MADPPIAPRAVSGIASMFAGSSKPTPAGEEQMLRTAMERQRVASASSDAARHAYRSGGSDFMSEFERMRRLEDEARRRAELEARNNLHSYNGSHALILALERLKLGLPLTAQERALLDAHAAALHLRITYSEMDIQRAQREALDESLRIEDANANAAHAAGATVGGGVAHNLTASHVSSVVIHDTPTSTALVLDAGSGMSRAGVAGPTHMLPEGIPRSAGYARSGSDSFVVSQMSSGHVAYGQGQQYNAAIPILTVIIDAIRACGRPMSLAEVYDCVCAQFNTSWSTFEPQFGSLHSFIGSYGPHAGVLLAGDMVTLAGMDAGNIIPIDALPLIPTHRTSMSAPGMMPSSYVYTAQGRAPANVGMPWTNTFAQPGVASGFQYPHGHMPSSGTMFSAMSHTPTPSQVVGVATAQAGPATQIDPFDILSASRAAAPMPLTGQLRPDDEVDLLGMPNTTGVASGVHELRTSRAAAPTAGVEQADGETSSDDDTSEPTAPSASRLTHARALPGLPQSQQGADAAVSRRAAPGEIKGRRTTQERMMVETVALLDIKPGSSEATAAAHAREASASRRHSTPGTVSSTGNGARELEHVSALNESIMPAARRSSAPPSAPAPAHTYGESRALVHGSAGATYAGAPPLVPRASIDRHTDVETLAQRAVRAGACDGDEALTWQDFDLLFRPVLVRGFVLIKHGRSGPPKRRRFWMTHALNRLYWETGKFIDIVRSGERHLEMYDVVNVISGAGTDLLRRKLARAELIPDDEPRLFSLVTHLRTLDMEAITVSQQRVLVYVTYNALSCLSPVEKR